MEQQCSLLESQCNYIHLQVLKVGTLQILTCQVLQETIIINNKTKKNLKHCVSDLNCVSI